MDNLKRLKTYFDLQRSDKTIYVLSKNIHLGKETIGCQQVYEIKYHLDESNERYKTRLVAKGYANKRVLITMKLFFLWLNQLLLEPYWQQQLIKDGTSTNLMLTMPSSMVSLRRKFTCKSHPGLSWENLGMQTQDYRTQG